MSIEFSEHAWNELVFWMDTDPEMLKKIKELLKEIKRTPFQRLGKPEPLKFELKGFWSRRISGEHRLVYKIEGKKGVDQKCYISQCRFHYDF